MPNTTIPPGAHEAPTEGRKGPRSPDRKKKWPIKPRSADYTEAGTPVPILRTPAAGSGLEGHGCPTVLNGRRAFAQLHWMGGGITPNYTGLVGE